MNKKNDVEKRAKAVEEIGMTAWLGGDSVQRYCARVGILVQIIEMLDDPEERGPIKLASIQALTMLGRNSRYTQDLCRKHRLLHILVDYLNHSDALFRMWAAHCLFFVVVGNATNQTVVLRLPFLKRRLARVAHDDWSLWTANDAEELTKMLWGGG